MRTNYFEKLYLFQYFFIYFYEFLVNYALKLSKFNLKCVKNAKKKILKINFINLAQNIHNTHYYSLTETGKDLIEFVEKHITEIPDNLECGFFIGVDLEYPTNLHDEHKDLPLAAEHFNGKLCLTLNDKIKYGTDYRCLKFYINNGLILKKIHYIIIYNQIDWMRSYIEFNTQKRKEAKSQIEKDFYKLLNNSIYGKTIENIRKRKNIKACVDGEQVAKKIRNPLYKHRTVIDENLVLVHMRKNKLIYDKPLTFLNKYPMECLYAFKYFILIYNLFTLTKIVNSFHTSCV